MANRTIGEQILKRLRKYGGEATRAAARLPENRIWRHPSDQLLRSGTAPGAHYNEAVGAQSRRDFIHKIALALKEMREAVYWVGVCVDGGEAPENAEYLLDEGDQLIAILAASLRTARRNED